MKSKKLTLAKPFRFNEILRLSIFFMLTMGLLSGCMVVRFDAHLATKGTKIKSDNDEDTGGPSTGTYGLHLKMDILLKPTDHQAKQKITEILKLVEELK